MQLTEAELAELQKRNPDLRIYGDGITTKDDSVFSHPKPPKYHAEITYYNGHRYHSKKEAEHAEDNDLRLKAGELSWWGSQIQFPLPGGITYIADFVETSKGGVHVIEIKPFDKKLQKFRYTKEYKLKRRLLKERYPNLTIIEI